MRQLISSALLILMLMIAGCDQKKERFPLDPFDAIDFTLPNYTGKAEATLSFDHGLDLEPVDSKLAARLKTPAGYRKTRTAQVAPGVLFRQYDLPNDLAPDPRQTLRVMLIAPAAFRQLEVLFSDQAHRPLSTQTVLARPGLQALMSWCFFGRIPAGDVIGQRCREGGRSCKPGIYHLAEKRTGKNINSRYSLAIGHNGKARFFRGGLGPSSTRWYKLAMGGGLLLYDKKTSPALYKAVGRKEYSKLYASKRYNHADFTAKGQAGYPWRNAPRSAAGLLPDGSLAIVNLGEGKYRFEGGASPARMALLLRQLGADSALMFDGGGAPQMVIKSRSGRLLARSWPEVTKSSNYLNNYAFLTLNRPAKK